MTSGRLRQVSVSDPREYAEAFVKAWEDSKDEEEGLLSDASSISDGEWEATVAAWEWEEAGLDTVLHQLGLPSDKLVR